MYDERYNSNRNWAGFLFVAILGGIILWGMKDYLINRIFGDGEISYSVSTTTSSDIIVPEHEYDTTWFLQNAHDVVIFYDDLNENWQRDPGEDLFNEQLDMWNGYWIPNNTGGSGLIEVWYTDNPYELYVKDKNGWSYPINGGEARSEYITAIYQANGVVVFELKMKK